MTIIPFPNNPHRHDHLPVTITAGEGAPPPASFPALSSNSSASPGAVRETGAGLPLPNLRPAPVPHYVYDGWTVSKERWWRP